MDGTLSQNAQPIVYRKELVLFLIMFVHLKFFIQIVMDIQFVLMDLALYGLLLACIDYRRIRWSFLVLIPIAMVSLMNPAARNIFVIFLLTYIISKLPLQAILWYNLISQFAIFSIATIFLLLGITESEMFQQTAFDTRVRYDYGMGNPNTFALFTYSAIINLYLFRGYRNKLVMWIILMICLAVAKYTGSRTFLVAVLFLLFCNLIKKYFANRKNLTRFIYAVIPLLFFGVIFYFSINYLEYPAVNLLFSGRLELYNSLINQSSTMQLLIGTPLINEKTIDNSFLHIVYEGGIIPLAVFLYLYYNLLFKSNSKEMSILLPLFISVFLVGLTESVLTFTLIFGNMIIWVIMYKVFMGETLTEMLNINEDNEEDCRIPSIQ